MLTITRAGIARDFNIRGPYGRDGRAGGAERRASAVTLVPALALSATLYAFEIELAHVDRGVYESLAFRAARHPSESAEYFVTRILAYCLEYTDGLAFSKGGLSDPDEAPLEVRDRTGARRAWIELGVPDAPRLHRAAKAAPRVVVYTHKDPGRLLRLLEGERIHRPEALELYAVDQRLVTEWADRLARRMVLSVTVSDGHVLIVDGEHTMSGEVQKVSMA